MDQQEKREQLALKQGQVLTLSSTDEENSGQQDAFQCRILSDHPQIGGSMICYDAEINHKRGRLKEFLPASMADHLSRNPSDNAVRIDTEAKLAFRYAVNDSADVFRNMEDRKNENETLKNYIPEYSVYYTKSDDPLQRTFYLFFQKYDDSTFEEFLQRIWKKTQENALQKTDLILDIGIQLCNVLELLHGTGLILNDLKPENFAVKWASSDAEDWHIVGLSLFDLDAVYDIDKDKNDGLIRTTEGRFSSPGLVGTEQGDVYAAAALIYYALTWNIPFEQLAEEGTDHYDSSFISEGLSMSALLEPLKKTEGFCEQLADILSSCLSLDQPYSGSTFLYAGRLKTSLEALRNQIHRNPDQYAMRLVNPETLWHAGKKVYEEMHADTFDDIFPNMENVQADQDVFGLLNMDSEANIALIGTGGIGKTTILQKLMADAYADREYQAGAKVRLYVELGKAPDYSNPEEPVYGNASNPCWIRRTLFHQLVKALPSQLRQAAEKVSFRNSILMIDSELNSSTTAKQYELYLDGWNEISSGRISYQFGEYAFITDLFELELQKLLSYRNVRIIVTSRTEDDGEPADLKKVHLNGLTENQITAYLKKQNHTDEQIAGIEKQNVLMDTLRIPLFLRMYGSLAEPGNIETQGEILHQFFHEKEEGLYTDEKRLETLDQEHTAGSAIRKKTRLPLRLQWFAIDFLLPQIGYTLNSEGKMYLLQDQLEDVVDGFLKDRAYTDHCMKIDEPFFRKYVITGRHAEMIRMEEKDMLVEYPYWFFDLAVNKLGILHQEEEGYRFSHHYIRDYFASQKVVLDLKEALYVKETEPGAAARKHLKYFEENLLDPEVSRLIGESLGETHNRPYKVPLESITPQKK